MYLYTFRWVTLDQRRVYTQTSRGKDPCWSAELPGLRLTYHCLAESLANKSFLDLVSSGSHVAQVILELTM